MKPFGDGAKVARDVESGRCQGKYWLNGPTALVSKPMNESGCGRVGTARSFMAPANKAKAKCTEQRQFWGTIAQSSSWLIHLFPVSMATGCPLQDGRVVCRFIQIRVFVVVHFYFHVSGWWAATTKVKSLMRSVAARWLCCRTEIVGRKKKKSAQIKINFN
jgi:hypothetical protein